MLLALPAILLGLAAAAGTPEEDYVAARDAAIAKIKAIEAKTPSADTGEIDQKALADLEKRLQAIIGDLAVKPYSTRGKITIETLSSEGIGSGGLDALRFANGEEGPQVYVTTDGLFTRWLAKPSSWPAEQRGNAPWSIEAALANSEFYTSAISQDAAFTKNADLPVTKPEGAAFAVALLGNWSQDIGPNPHQHIIVAIRTHGKVYIATENASRYQPIAACEAVWKDAEKQAAAIFKKYQDGGAKDEKIFDSYTAMQNKGDQDYHACYIERMPREAFFPALTGEAQAIANRFAGK
jgi:hypothetical protein